MPSQAGQIGGSLTRAVGVLIALASGVFAVLPVSAQNQRSLAPEVLVRNLESNDAVVRAASASLLAQYAEALRGRRFRPGQEGEMAYLRQAAGAALARLVGDPVTSVRQAAVLAVADVRAEAATAVAAWEKALNDPEVQVRHQVPEALRRYLDRAVETAGPLSYPEQLASLVQFLRDAETVAPLLRQCLQAEDLALRRDTLRAVEALLDTLENLPEIAGRNIDPLAITEEATEPVRRAIVPTASAVRSLLPPVVAAARSGPAETQRQALLVIEKTALLCDPRPDYFERRETGTGRLRGRLHRGDLGPSAQEALHLLQEGVQEAIPALLAVAERPPVETQLAVLDVFEVAGPTARQAVPHVRRQLEHPNRFVRWAAGRALAAIGAGEDAAENRATVVALAERLADDDLDVAVACCHYLGQAFARQAAPALEALGRAATSEERQLQYAAVEALYDIVAVLGAEAKPAVPGLMVALTSPDLKTRQLAPLVLAGIGPAAAEAVPALEKALLDGDLEVRQNAAQALLKIRTH